MAKQEDPELTLCHGHTEAATASTTTNSENDPKTGREDLPQRGKRGPHQKEEEG